MLATPGERENIELGPDNRSARARFTRLMRVEAAIASSGSLADMAREQGQGVSRWWENGEYELDYTKDGSAWKISRLVYRSAPTSVPAPADLGAPPRRVPHFSSTFPQHPTGPDRLTRADSAA